MGAQSGPLVEGAEFVPSVAVPRPQPVEPYVDSAAVTVSPVFTLEGMGSQAARIPFPAQHSLAELGTSSTGSGLESNGLPAKEEREKREVCSKAATSNEDSAEHVTANEGGELDGISEDNTFHGRKSILNHNLFKWQAAENLVVNAIMLRMPSDDVREHRLRAACFFTELAQATREDPRPVLERVREVVRDDITAMDSPHPLAVSE